jgi:hypothetical protein
MEKVILDKVIKQLRVHFFDQKDIINAAEQRGQ